MSAVAHVFQEPRAPGTPCTGNTFGDVAEAMLGVLREADSWNIHPLVHALNPYGSVCGFGPGLRQVPEAGQYGRLFELPTIGGELPLVPGMSFSSPKATPASWSSGCGWRACRRWPST